MLFWCFLYDLDKSKQKYTHSSDKIEIETLGSDWKSSLLNDSCKGLLHIDYWNKFLEKHYLYSVLA